MSELARICRNDGFIALTTAHPTMHLLGVSARFNDPETGRKIYPKSYDHTVSAFVMAAECQRRLRVDPPFREIATGEVLNW